MSIVESLIQSGFSQSTLLNAVHDRIGDALDGKIDIVDTTSPFATLLDAGVCLSAANMMSQEVGLRKVYKVLSQNYDDLYHHMSDEEYLGRFCSYSSANFFMYLRKDELLVKAVKVSGSDVRKIIIPKHTKIKVDATMFTLLYPIEIRIMPHGGFQIVYDTSVRSPIASLETNYIDWKIVNIDGYEYVMLVFRLPQLLRKVYTDTLNPSASFSREYTVNDQFYYCRVFGTDENGNRMEFSTTHSEVVYDINVPTALLTVLENKIRVEVPRIYFSKKMLGTSVEIVIYSSKGELNLDFSKDYELNSFTMELSIDYNEPADSVYSAPLSTWSSMAIGSYDKTTGGSNGMSVATLRQNNIDNANNINNPITFAQLRTRLRLDGYDIIASVDNIMQRIYLATRHLPAIQGSGFTSGASTSVETLLTTLSKLAQHSTVIDNGNRITVTPDTVFKHNENGVLEVVPEAMLPSLAVPDALAADVNKNNYMFTPFHYVLDINDDQFKSRPYYLTAPSLTSRKFLMENETVLLGVSSDSFKLEKVPEGYIITVVSVGGDSYLEQDPAKLFAQLSYVPTNERGRAAINGTIVGITEKNNYVWEFLIATDLDIDEHDSLLVTNFSMFADQYRDFGMSLEQEFEIVYGILDYDVFGLKRSEIDTKIATYLLDGNPIGITNESLTVRIGSALRNLWSNTRTVVGSARYKVHEFDVPKVHANTVLLTDAGGTPILELVDGVAQYTVLHRKGDPVLDAEGNPEMEFTKGQIVNVDGNPVVLYDRETERMVDFLMVDGVYRFASLPRDTTYRDTIAETVANFATNDMKQYLPKLHEKTELYFYPKKTLGRVKVIVNSGMVIEIDAALAFTVRFYMERSKYTNLALRDAITVKTKEIINRSLQSATVSRDSIQKALKEAMGDDVVAIDMDNLGASKNIPTFTSIDDGTRCAVRRRLKVMPDNTVMVEEDITVDWIDHIA